MIKVNTVALKEARIRAGLTQREMNRKLRKSSGYMSLVESGLSGVSPKSAMAICKILNAEFDDFFEIEVQAPSNQETQTA